MANHILTLNAGSSSIKFALFTLKDRQELVRGQVEGIAGDANIEARLGDGTSFETDILAATHSQALAEILSQLNYRFKDANITVVGHRVVHGGLEFTAPVRVTDQVMAKLEALTPLAPLHQPHNLAGLEAAMATFPDALQVACFDTAFHRSHPWVNDTFALPTRFYDQGVRRYGFHGLSYEFIVQEMERIAPFYADGRMVVAHLGNGASMCAIRDGQSIGSTMGFSALDGLPMGTRCGQVDPGVVLHLIRQMGMSAEEVENLLYRDSGLKGLSGISNDVREIESAGTRDAMRAIDYFVFRTRRELGALTAVLNGLDAFVLAGGIGENAWHIREEICSGFEWLGMELDRARNKANETIISSDRSRVRVFAISTDEEAVIAEHASGVLAATG